MAERAAKPANNEGAKYVERIENLNTEMMGKLKSKHMSDCKAIRTDQKIRLGIRLS